MSNEKMRNKAPGSLLPIHTGYPKPQNYYVDFGQTIGFRLLLFKGNDIVARIPLTEKQYDDMVAAGVPTL